MARTTVVHISDTHLGKRQPGSGVVWDDFTTAFERAIDVAVERDVDAVVHTGDIFDDPRPALPTVTHCVDVLDSLTEHGIPLYGIVGNREQRTDEQGLDLFGRTDAVTRLGREARVVEDTALYGIDAVRLDDWQTTDLSLERPPAGVECTILCMHELLEPPGTETTADYPAEAVLDRVDVDLDGLALGGFHQPASARVDGTDVWYAGATKRAAANEAEAGAVQLVEIEDGTVTRQQVDLAGPPSGVPGITDGRRDGVEHVHQVVDRGDRPDPVEHVDDGAVTANEVTQLAKDPAVADDGRRCVDCSVRERTDGIRQTAQNAVETAALRSLRRPSGRGTLPASRNAAETATGEANRDELDRPEAHDDTMTEELEELIRERDRLDAGLAELGTTIDEAQLERDEIEDDLATAITERDTETEAFLPDDRLPASVTNETRDAIASHLDALGEKRDVRSEELARKEGDLKVETKTAADAREDIYEIAGAIDRLGDRADEAESRVDDAREELNAARSRFTDDLVVLATRLETFDIALSEDTLTAVVEERIPERNGEIQASIEGVRSCLAELSTRKSKLVEDRDKLQSIEGGGSCPTCNQNVGPERSESELDAVLAELDEVERKLGAARQERDDLIARREELDDLRQQAITLRTFRSETVAVAEGLVEDRQENFEDLQADLEEERAGLAASRGERDEADAAIATLEEEIADLEAEIEELQAKTTDGEACLDTFDVVDDLEAQRDTRDGEIAELQETYAEKEAERAALDGEIENLAE